MVNYTINKYMYCTMVYINGDQWFRISCQLHGATVDCHPSTHGITLFITCFKIFTIMLWWEHF